MTDKEIEILKFIGANPMGATIDDIQKNIWFFEKKFIDKLIKNEYVYIINSMIDMKFFLTAKGMIYLSKI